MNVWPSAPVTVLVSGSTPVTWTCFTATDSSFLKIARRDRATSVAESSAVATWYRSGWNWW